MNHPTAQSIEHHLLSGNDMFVEKHLTICHRCKAYVNRLNDFLVLFEDYLKGEPTDKDFQMAEEILQQMH